MTFSSTHLGPLHLGASVREQVSGSKCPGGQWDMQSLFENMKRLDPDLTRSTNILANARGCKPTYISPLKYSKMASILQSFEEYQKSRVKFVQAVAEAATRPQNIEIMNNAGVMQLLRPLLLDTVRIQL